MTKTEVSPTDQKVVEAGREAVEKRAQNPRRRCRRVVPGDHPPVRKYSFGRRVS